MSDPEDADDAAEAAESKEELKQEWDESQGGDGAAEGDQSTG